MAGRLLCVDELLDELESVELGIAEVFVEFESKLV
jgi:hypothetical protein